MNDKGETLEEAENEASKVLNKELDHQLDLTETAYNLICLAIDTFPEISILDMPESMKVVVNLLVKISNDIRCSSLLVAKGYPIQATSIVASMYESAYMVAYIGLDNERAAKWIDHEDPKKLFIGFVDLTKEAIKNFNVSEYESIARKEYVDYRQLCMVKHSNPLFQKQQGYQIEGKYILAINGPDNSVPSIRLSWFVLEKSINYVLIALGSFINSHLSQYEPTMLIKQYKELEEHYNQINKMAIRRWGTENPFPDKLI